MCSVLIIIDSLMVVMSSTLNPLCQMKQVFRLLSICFLEKLCSLLLSCRFAVCFYQISLCLPMEKMKLAGRVEESSVEEERQVCLFDLPDLALECILEKLPPDGLCNVAAVCTYLRDKCASDYLWKKYMDQKWGRFIGDAAYKEWRLHISSTKKRPTRLVQNSTETGIFGFVQKIYNFSWLGHDLKPTCFQPTESVMGFYLAMEGGKFWFPAQVYNKENGNIGFMLSCYDAKLKYDSSTDTFRARYSRPHGRRTIEENIHWDRIRVPAVDTGPYALHISDCLNDLNPGDYVEIQWRRNKEFPYGWWYSVVGHLESCIGNDDYCHCRYSDMVILEFKQYIPGSRWRKTWIRRTDHREEGNEADGYYGGIRKLYRETEISVWKSLWPSQILE